MILILLIILIPFLLLVSWKVGHPDVLKSRTSGSNDFCQCGQIVDNFKL